MKAAAKIIAGSARKVREHKGSANTATAPATKILRLIIGIPFRREDSGNNSATGWGAAFNKPLRRRQLRTVLAASIRLSFRGAQSASPESIHPRVLWPDGFRVCAFGASRNDEREGLSLSCWRRPGLVCAPRQAEMLSAAG